MTVGNGHDLEVAHGTTVAEIADAARAIGAPLDEAWCGDARLDPQHPAGAWPLLEGALLNPNPGLPCAPPRGPALLVIAGPGAGRLAPVGPDGIVIGRGREAGLVVDDPTVSRAHFFIAPGVSLKAKDLGSSNGTTLWRGSTSRRIGRSATTQIGDVFAVGTSLVAVVGPAERPPEPDPSRPATPQESSSLTGRLAPAASSAISGVMIAAMTGRWYIALLGLVYPVFLLVSSNTVRFRKPRSFWDLAVLPSLLPESRRAWSTRPPRSVAVIGDDERTRAFARALTLAIGRRPKSGWEEPWMRWLPDPHPDDPEFTLMDGGEPPSWSDALATANPGGWTLTRDGTAHGLPPVAIGPREADSLARTLAGESGGRLLPPRVRWADLAIPDPERRSGLVSPLGVSSSGSYVLDLDSHGPHFLIAGTTGSGKSALIETLVLGLALEYPPNRIGIALIDFKGGAGVRALTGLPHLRGILTDLDPHLARRALRALARELEERKEALAKVGLSSFQDWEAEGGAPPRLLVVADEYQELAAQYREFLPDLARLAAQGRSLGLHLVLATQRPAGAVTPEIRANIGTTIALRVVTDAESRDLVGTPDATEIGTDTPGRAIVLTGTRRTRIQAALACLTPTPRVRPWGDRDDLAESARAMAGAACEKWDDRPHASPLWLPPLPCALDDDRGGADSDPNPEDGLWLGVGDFPEERRQSGLFWDPRSGPLAVAGPPRSGRTTALRLLALRARSVGLRPVWLPSDPREAARTIALSFSLPDVLLLVDDAHRALAILADTDRGIPVESLTSRACSGLPLAFALPKGGTHRLAQHATAFLIFTGGDPVDDAGWSMPRDLAGIAPGPGRARFGVAGRWCECQVGQASDVVDEPLVTPLPSRLNRADLGDGFIIGVGGDDGGSISVDPDLPVVVLGPPGTARAAVEASLREVAGLRGRPLDVELSESLLARPRTAPEPGAVIVVEPTERLAREAFRGSLDGLIDPYPPPLRVVIVQHGRALAAQLADPPEDGDRRHPLPSRDSPPTPDRKKTLRKSLVNPPSA